MACPFLTGLMYGLGFGVGVLIVFFAIALVACLFDRCR